MNTKPSYPIIADFNMLKLDGLALLRAVRECEPLTIKPYTN